MQRQDQHANFEKWLQVLESLGLAGVPTIVSRAPPFTGLLTACKTVSGGVDSSRFTSVPGCRFGSFLRFWGVSPPYGIPRSIHYYCESVVPITPLPSRSHKFHMRAIRSLALLMLLLPSSGSALYAQDHRASIRGIVLDPALKGMAGVEVRVLREDTGESRTVRSDEQGGLSFPELPPAVYRVMVEHAGYGPFVARAELAMNQEVWVRVPLQIGTVIQAIDVNEPFIPVDRDTPALHTFIDERAITELPLDGRNFLELALLAPGAVPPPQGSASSARGDFALSINGAREDFNGFLLDGVYNVDPKLNTPGVRPPADGIRQFQVFTSSYDASFGRNAGGQINVVTKSGANQFSGSGYEFFRNRHFNARNHFAPEDAPAPDYNRHQFGGSVGGPIAANRTFFFADYEHTYLREGITKITNVPTAAERNGDFSQTLFNRPINFLAGSRASAGCLNSAMSACTSGESHAGGGGALNSLAELNRKGFQPGIVTLAGLVPTQLHVPVGTVPDHTASAPSDLARSMTRAATWRPSSIPAK